MQVGHAALTRMRSVTPPRAAAAWPAPVPAAAVWGAIMQTSASLPVSALQQTQMANAEEDWDLETDGDPEMDASVATMLARLGEAHAQQAGDEAATAIAKETLRALTRTAMKGRGKGGKGDRFEPT